MRTIPSLRRRHYLARFSIFLVTAALIMGMVGCNGGGDGYTPPSQDLEICDWYELDAIRDNLGGNHRLMNDLDSTTAGYEELASPTANQEKGWQPIGTSHNSFTGTFDGQGYEIRDLFINRPDEMYVGLFGVVGEGGVVQNTGVVNATVTGYEYVGGLMGGNAGSVTNSYFTGSVSNSGGQGWVGGLVGENGGTVSNSYSTGNVIGVAEVGGLVGENMGTVSNSYCTGNVAGAADVGGLVGEHEQNTISNCYATGNVTGNCRVGGLVGQNHAGTVCNSYSTGSVAGAADVGGLVGRKQDEEESTVSNSFWDTETSGQATSYGGTGKNTTEMQDIATFTDTETEGLDEPWDITAVAPVELNPSYTWNIVDDETYPFLSWQS